MAGTACEIEQEPANDAGLALLPLSLAKEKRLLHGKPSVIALTELEQNVGVEHPARGVRFVERGGFAQGQRRAAELAPSLELERSHGELRRSLCAVEVTDR